jgi:endonuclease/exonuclease/phosphatase family metal-dependent hydrolase
MVNKLTVGTWNICGQSSGRTARKAKLLELEHWDVVLLQEVRAIAFKEISLALGLGHDPEGPSGALGMAMSDPGKGGRSHGAAVLVRPPWRIIDRRLLPLDDGGDGGIVDPALLARSVCCRITDGQREVHVVSMHAQDQASDDPERTKHRKKMLQFRSIDSWVRAAMVPMVAGVDINGWHDFAVVDDVEGLESLDDQAQFLAPGAEHGLIDVAREVLVRDDPERLRRRRALGAVGEDGALEVTFSRYQGRVNRMDRIFVSPDLYPVRSRTLYEDGLTAGSDHALVLAELELP